LEESLYSGSFAGFARCFECERFRLAGGERCLAYLRTLELTTQACRKYGEQAAAQPPRRLLRKLLPQLTATTETKCSIS